MGDSREPAWTQRAALEELLDTARETLEIARAERGRDLVMIPAHRLIGLPIRHRLRPGEAAPPGLQVNSYQQMWFPTHNPSLTYGIAGQVMSSDTIQIQFQGPYGDRGPTFTFDLFDIPSGSIYGR